MTTKTASVRLEQELYERIDSHCVSDGCSRNDFIKNAIESVLNNNKQDDDVEHKPYTDSIGNRWYWNYNSNDWVCEINPKNMRIEP